MVHVVMTGLGSWSSMTGQLIFKIHCYYLSQLINMDLILLKLKVNVRRVQESCSRTVLCKMVVHLILPAFLSINNYGKIQQVGHETDLGSKIYGSDTNITSD